MRKKKLTKETKVEKIVRQEKDRNNHAKHRLKEVQRKEKPQTIPSKVDYNSQTKVFGNKQALGKAISRAKRNLPSSPRKRVAVVQKLASQYPTKLPSNFKKVPYIIDDKTKETVTNFYAGDSISSQAPGLRDFFIIRDENGK